jgi:hypothetical protein
MLTSFHSVFDADSEYDLGFVENLNFDGENGEIRAPFGQKCQNFNKREISQRRSKIKRQTIYTFVARYPTN